MDGRLWGWEGVGVCVLYYHKKGTHNQYIMFEYVTEMNKLDSWYSVFCERDKELDRTKASRFIHKRSNKATAEPHAPRLQLLTCNYALSSPS